MSHEPPGPRVAREPTPARATFAAALDRLEACLDDVRAAAASLADERRQETPSLALLDLVQMAICQARAAGPGDDLLDAGRRVVRTEAAARARRVEDALWAVRKALRSDPAAAVARLAALDLDGIDRRLAEQAYGEWRRQCARLRLPGAVRHDAGFGRGAVLVPDGPDHLRVVSAIGLPDLAPGRRVPRRELGELRQLT